MTTYVTKTITAENTFSDTTFFEVILIFPYLGTFANWYYPYCTA